MNDPRLPKLTQNTLRFLPEPVRQWMASFTLRLTELFRSMRPASGWKDLLADINSAMVAGNDPPSWEQVSGGIWAYQFSATAMNECWVNFHIPHDIAFSLTKEDGTSQAMTLYPHIHWISAGTNTGTVRFGIEYTYAKGYGQQVFPASTTIYLEQASDGTANKHFITETDDDSALVNEDFEPDGLLMCRIFRDAAHANDTLTDNVFIIFADLHYYSDGLQTNERNRSANEIPWTKRETLES